MADPGREGESPGPFGSNGPASQAEPRGPLASPGFWLHHAALSWRQLFDRRLRPLNLTPTQFMLLAAAGWLAASAGQPPTQQEVADHAGADRMMTSKVLQTLVDRGLVQREPDPADGRMKRLRLTPEGRELGRCPRPLDDGGAVGFGRPGRHQPAVGTGPSIWEDTKKQQSG